MDMITVLFISSCQSRTRQRFALFSSPPAHHHTFSQQYTLTLHPISCIPHPAPYTLHPTLYTLHSTPFTLSSTPVHHNTFSQQQAEKVSTVSRKS